MSSSHGARLTQGGQHKKTAILHSENCYFFCNDDDDYDYDYDYDDDDYDSTFNFSLDASKLRIG